MWDTLVDNSKTTCDTHNRSHEFLVNLVRVEAAFGLGYSFILFYLGAKFTGLVFLITTLTILPLIVFLDKKKFEVSARFLLIGCSLIYIYSAIIGIKFEIGAEFYYSPVMTLSLLLFDVRQKKEAIIGMVPPLLAWFIGHWVVPPTLPSSWSPNYFPDELFRNLSFIGSFFITAMFLNYYRKYVLALKKIVESDLEKTKSIERNLNEAQRLSKLGNWELDLISNKLQWSDEIYRIFEIEKDQFDASYEAFLDFTHPEDRDEINLAYTNSLKTQRPYEIVHRLLMPDGRIKFVREQCETFYTLEGKPIRSLGTVQDISESQRNEVRLQSSSKMAALGEMAGGIAHEINSPLTIIRGKAKQLLRKIEMTELDKENMKTDLGKIVSTIEKISKIVNALRSISRNAEVDSMELASLQNIIEEVLELGQERFKSSSVELRLNISTETWIMCRPSEIAQVILNLINNSFDAVLNLDEKWVEIKVLESGENVKIIVMDSGNGIPKAIHEKLMQPFFTTKEVGKGTGLGLSISKRIIEKHLGKFYYDTNSKNTCFIVEIPSKATSFECAQKAG